MILGATGSVGRQAISVCQHCGFEIAAVSGNTNVAAMEAIARKNKIKRAAMADERSAADLRLRLADTETVVTSDVEQIASVEADIVVNSIVGIAGLKPTLAAISAGNDVALANKETLVAAGKIVMERAAEKNVKILPVDSEHSAVFQCMQGGGKIKKIILTASGGPFFGMSYEQLKGVTKAQALKHPNWSMGAKITIDCATLMNKGFELIEAVHLFGVDESQVEILIHRESVIHSMVEFEDNSILAQMGNPDMRLPIQYALTYPQRSPSAVEPLNLSQIGRLTFFACDEQVFVPIALCRKAIASGGTISAVLNGANERAVTHFLEDRIKFTDIGEILEKIYMGHNNIKNPDIEQILEADRSARAEVDALMERSACH